MNNIKIKQVYIKTKIIQIKIEKKDIMIDLDKHKIYLVQNIIVINIYGEFSIKYIFKSILYLNIHFI